MRARAIQMVALQGLADLGRSCLRGLHSLFYPAT